ncbi:MAG: preprotein translocase subunit SecY [Candidatus Dadabacteria bacterium]|nr:MAG: preprotein translocase subunit SecY [Candidatus Dadabacteria bacterium]
MRPSTAPQTSPELRNRILFTLGMLAVYRLGCFIPTPGVNADALADFFNRTSGTLFGMFNLFSGGALKRFSIFALGIMPYISASIILQLLTYAVPYLEELKKEGQIGQKKITQYTRYLTVGLSLIQSFAIATALESTQGPGGALVVAQPGIGFRLMTALTLTTGTSFLMWVGEQMTERGIGNGISLIIYAGIVAVLPGTISNTVEFIRTGELQLFTLILLLAFMLAVTAAIVYMETSFRKIPIQYAKRVSGRKVYGGQSTHLPIKINTAGVIPPIFASSLLMFPLTITNFMDTELSGVVQQWFSPGAAVYNVVYFLLILGFAYFYTAVTFNPVDVADNLKRWGGYVPGIRPGRPTADYIERILNRLTLIGGLYVAIVCVLPAILVAEFNVPFYFGGTGLLIVVGVAMDTMQQVETHLISQRYEGLTTGGRIRGRRR